MPRIDAEVETPVSLLPYLAHGVQLSWKSDDERAYGDCPLCTRSDKFGVRLDNGLFKCWKCLATGNAVLFLRKLHDIAVSKCSALAQDRGLLSEQSLADWKIRKSPITGIPLIPGYNVQGNLCQLYRYTRAGERMAMKATPELGHKILGMNLWDKKKETVWLCEGVWDAITLWEVLQRTLAGADGSLTTTNIPGSSLYTACNVLAVPSCTVFQESWASLFAGKCVNLMFDNDHPRVHPQTGAPIPPAGLEGMKRVASILIDQDDPPASINYLKWGSEGYDLNLKSGTDLRDVLVGDTTQRVTALAGLIMKMQPVPNEWLVAPAGSKSKQHLELESCDNYEIVVEAWKKAMRWIPGLDHAFSAMLSSVISTKSLGSQLWIQVISPPSTGKTVLCEALSVNHEYVLAKSTLRGFHSGYLTEDKSEDHSLISRLAGKTLVTKDGDTLLQAPNLGQILSEARDIYDTTSRTSYRNAYSSRDYTGVRMTWILCGTSSLHALDQSELGERFLRVVIMDGIDDELEDEILGMVADRADRNLAIEADGKAESHQDPEMTKAMQLTGGYVDYIRKNANELLSIVQFSPEAKHLCTRFGKFVAFMRARPSSKQDETAEREFAARLVEQHIRLAKCLAAVLNKLEIDEEVMSRVLKIALDTSRGQTLDIARALYEAKNGLEVTAIATQTGRTDDKTRAIMRFLRRIKVAEDFRLVKPGVSRSVRWRLTEKFKRLYEQVVEQEPIQIA